jgi:hypothetical protein
MPELKPEREILRQADLLLHVINPQPGYIYAAERMGGASGNTHLTRAQIAGYELVRGDDPENPSQRDASGFCVIGDVALMRIKEDTHKEIQKDNEAILARKRGVDRSSDGNLAQQLSDELSRRFGKQMNVVFSYQDPKELSQRR